MCACVCAWVWVGGWLTVPLLPSSELLGCLKVRDHIVFIGEQQFAQYFHTFVDAIAPSEKLTSQLDKDVRIS